MQSERRGLLMAAPLPSAAHPAPPAASSPPGSAGDYKSLAGAAIGPRRPHQDIGDSVAVDITGRSHRKTERLFGEGAVDPAEQPARGPREKIETAGVHQTARVGPRRPHGEIGDPIAVDVAHEGDRKAELVTGAGPGQGDPPFTAHPGLTYHQRFKAGSQNAGLSRTHQGAASPNDRHLPAGDRTGVTEHRDFRLHRCNTTDSASVGADHGIDPKDLGAEQPALLVARHVTQGDLQ